MASVPPTESTDGRYLNPYIGDPCKESYMSIRHILTSMGRTWSVYVSDDELNEKIETLIEGGDYYNQADFWTSAAEREIEAEEPEKLV